MFTLAFIIRTLNPATKPNKIVLAFCWASDAVIISAAIYLTIMFPTMYMRFILWLGHDVLGR